MATAKTCNLQFVPGAEPNKPLLMPCELRASKSNVVFIYDQRPVFDFSWQDARRLSTALASRCFRAAQLAEAPKVCIEFICDGQQIFKAHWKSVQRLSMGLLMASQEAEVYARRDELANDNAILLRMGMPFGLTDNPEILKESVHRAECLTKLPCVENVSIVGAPVIINESLSQGG